MEREAPWLSAPPSCSRPATSPSSWAASGRSTASPSRSSRAFAPSCWAPTARARACSCARCTASSRPRPAPCRGTRPARQAMVFQRPVMLRRSALANIRYALAVNGVAEPERTQARLLGARARGPRGHRLPPGPRALRRRAAAPGARARLGPRARDPLPRRAHGEPRPGRHRRDRARHRLHRGRGHAHRHDHAQPRPGPAPGRRDRLHPRRPGRRSAPRPTGSSTNPHRAKHDCSFKENCHGNEPPPRLLALQPHLDRRRHRCRSAARRAAGAARRPPSSRCPRPPPRSSRASSRTCCRSSRRPPASRCASWPWAPARRSTWPAAATRTWSSCTTRSPRTSSSPRASA